MPRVVARQTMLCTLHQADVPSNLDGPLGVRKPLQPPSLLVIAPAAPVNMPVHYKMFHSGLPLRGSVDPYGLLESYLCLKYTCGAATPPKG